MPEHIRLNSLTFYYAFLNKFPTLTPHAIYVQTFSLVFIFTLPLRVHVDLYHNTDSLKLNYLAIKQIERLCTS